MLVRFSRLRREEFELDDTRYEQLGREVERWRETSAGACPSSGD